MSVLYDKLKQVEQGQDTSSPAGEQESLPMEEELQRQHQEKKDEVKHNLGKWAFFLLIVLTTVVFFNFVWRKSNFYTEKAKPSSPSSSRQVLAQASTVAKTPITAGQSARKRRKALNKKKMRLPHKNKPQLLIKTKAQPTAGQEKNKAAEQAAAEEKVLSIGREGQKLYQAGKLDKAITVYKKALQENPQQIEVYNNMGVVYTRKGLLEKAIENFKKALKTNPYYAEAHYNLAVVLEKKQANRQALVHYLKFVEYARPAQAELAEKVRRYIQLD